MIGNNVKTKDIVEFGDYQTPEDFVDKVCLYLKNNLNINPKYILEPTFGLGNFIKGSLKAFNNVDNIFGIELNKKYYDYASDEISKLHIMDNKVVLFNENIFNFDFNKIKSKINKTDSLLVIGNPPWVTNSELTSMDSSNLPIKENFKGLSGLDAITGKGNFDIAEYIMLQLLNEFKDYNCYIAMLCKNIVAKNIVRDLEKYDFTLSEIKMLCFNANDVFNVSCEACLLIMKVGGKERLICDVYDFNKPTKKIRMFGWMGGNFISDLGNYSQDIDGLCQLEWRQGIKHDCSKVMELTHSSKNEFTNGLKEKLHVEDDYIYPLLKSSDIKKYIIKDTRKYVIVTQRKVREETDSIKDKSPLLWNYLQEHSQLLDNRKSSIYKKAPRFAIFGVGDYSFKPYKVAISGFYKTPLFALVYNTIEKPIMLDDTCYFLGFDNYNHALITTLLLNSKIVQNFIKSIAFLDSKRPYTKDILMRIDLLKVVENISFKDLISIADNLKIEHNLINDDYIDFSNSLRN